MIKCSISTNLLVNRFACNKDNFWLDGISSRFCGWGWVWVCWRVWGDDYLIWILYENNLKCDTMNHSNHKPSSLFGFYFHFPFRIIRIIIIWYSYRPQNAKRRDRLIYINYVDYHLCILAYWLLSLLTTEMPISNQTHVRFVYAFYQNRWTRNRNPYWH